MKHKHLGSNPAGPPSGKFVGPSGLVTRRTSLPPTAPPKEDPLEEIGGTIYEEVKNVVIEEIPHYITKALSPLRDEILESSAAAAGRVVGKELNGLREDVKSEIDRIINRYESMIQETKAHYNDALDRMMELIKSLPIPQVTIPNDAVRVEVKQLPSTVNVAAPNITVPKDAISVNVKNEASIVNIPDGAINVNVKSEPSIVNLPEGSINVNVKSEPSIVNIPKDAIHIKQMPSKVEFKVPEKAFKLQAAPPRKKTTKKSIEYGPDGRPQSITEEEEEK